MSDSLHKCANPSCEAQVSITRFACNACWWQLPEAIRHGINVTYRPTAPVQNAKYLASALRGKAWFREHVAPVAREREPGEEG